MSARTTRPKPLPSGGSASARAGGAASPASARVACDVAGGHDGAGAHPPSATTVSTPVIRGPVPSSSTSSRAAPSPSTTRPPSASSRRRSAAVSPPEPPTGWPGGTSCSSATQPTMAAVPGSDIGGPDWAPNQASAALSRSLPNQRSSRASPEPRKSTASSPPGVRGGPSPGAPSGQNERISPAGAGPAAERGDDRAAARAPHRDEPAVGGGVLRAAGGGDGGAGGVQVDGEDQRPPVGPGVARGRRGREAPRVAVDVAQPVGGEVQLLDDAALPDDDVRAGAAVDAHAGPALDGGDRAAEHRRRTPRPRPTGPARAR